MIPIVFIGSGPVAAKSLELLVNDFEVTAVITKPKPAHHHGNFPVIDVATQLNLSLYTVNNKKELSELFNTTTFASDLAVLIDFGIIVSQDVINYFPKGIINSHFSLLPEWRGADPITFSILSGQKQTGVSLMLLVEAMDEGPILGVGKYDLVASITTPKLTDDLIDLSFSLLKSTIPRYLDNEVEAASQSETADMMGYTIKPSYSRKLTKQDGILDFNKSAAQLEREIRAFIDWPKSRTELAGKEVVITKSHVVKQTLSPGEIVVDGKQLLIGTSEHSLAIDRLKPAGKQDMDIAGFLAGYSQYL